MMVTPGTGAPFPVIDPRMKREIASLLPAAGGLDCCADVEAGFIPISTQLASATTIRARRPLCFVNPMRFLGMAEPTCARSPRLQVFCEPTEPLGERRSGRLLNQKCKRPRTFPGRYDIRTDFIRGGIKM